MLLYTIQSALVSFLLLAWEVARYLLCHPSALPGLQELAMVWSTRWLTWKAELKIAALSPRLAQFESQNIFCPQRRAGAGFESSLAFSDLWNADP